MSIKSKFFTALSLFFCIVAVIAYNKVISSNDKIVAKIGEKAIYEADVKKEYEAILGRSGKSSMDYDKLNANMKENIIKSIVIGDVVDEEAKKAGVEKSTEYKESLDYTLRELRQKIFLDDVIKKNVTDDMVKQAYKEASEKMKNETEAKIDYLLFTKEEDAKQAIVDLKTQADFSKLADAMKAKSVDVKFEQVDFFAKGEMMSEEMDNAIFNAKKNEVVGPVKTEFGWAVVRLLETRQKVVPTYEEMEANLRNGLVEKFISQFVEKLQKDAKIEFMNQ
jgi:peptidyl-prolyl cis-trans isomerase C